LVRAAAHLELVTKDKKKQTKINILAYYNQVSNRTHAPSQGNDITDKGAPALVKAAAHLGLVDPRCLFM